MGVQEFCPIDWWFCRVREGENLSCVLVDTALSSVGGLVRSRAGESGEKGLSVCPATHHARQFLSDTKTPWLLPSTSGAENGFPSTFWEAFLPPAISHQELGTPGHSLSGQSMVVFTKECKVVAVFLLYNDQSSYREVCPALWASRSNRHFGDCSSSKAK